MANQWHPLFARLLSILIDKYYTVETEVPVSDLPRRGDLFLIRRQGTETPPFRGLWSRLTDWNVVEFKGPTDAAEIDDLELLAHVGTGLTYRTNEKRAADEPRIANRQVSFWYLAPKLGETFLGHARTLTPLDYETGGLWRGTCWGHRVYLLSYEDAQVEVDTLPLYLMGDEAKTPKEVATVVLQHEELFLDYAEFISAFQPLMFKEIRRMAEKMIDGPRLNWKAIGEITDLHDVLEAIPRADLASRLGDPGFLKQVGVSKILAAVGQPEGFDANDAATLLKGLMAQFTPEQVQTMLRQVTKE